MSFRLHGRAGDETDQSRDQPPEAERRLHVLLLRRKF
jgi:hypothetical protein